MNPRRLPWSPGAFVVAAFIVSRLLYGLLGVRFDSSHLGQYVQIADPELLRHHLLQTLWYLHSQPPLYNAFLGIVLKLAGRHYGVAFQIMYAAAGLALALALYGIMAAVGVGRRTAAVVAAVYSSSPAVVLYENWLYVDYLVAAALVVAAWALVRYCTTRASRHAVMFFSLLAAVVLSATLFHVVWLLLVALATVVLIPRHRRQLIVAAAVPCLACVGLYTKTAVMYRTFAGTTCPGVNAERVATVQLSYPERLRLAAEHKLSLFAVVNPFSASQIRPYLVTPAPRRVPILDEPVKSTGAVNFDNLAYIGICNHLLDDALTVARNQPSAVARGIGRGAMIYTWPASEYPLFTKRNRDSVALVDHVFTLALGQIRRAPPPAPFSVGDGASSLSLGQGLVRTAWFVVLAYLATFVLTVRFLRSFRRHPKTGDCAMAVLSAFVLLAVGYVTILGSVFEAGENNRLRFSAEPLVLALLVAYVSRRRSRLAAERAYDAHEAKTSTHTPDEMPIV